MSPRGISDAQARCLSLIDEQTDVLLAGKPSALRELRGRAALWWEDFQPQPNGPLGIPLPTVKPLRVTHASLPRGDTLARVIADGYVLLTPRVVPLPRAGGGTGTWQQLDLSADGKIALGLWRGARFAAPPASLPEVSSVDRRTLALAAAANELGYDLVPRPAARRRAASLARRDLVVRRPVGRSVRTIVPTGVGLVEAAPERADAPVTSGNGLRRAVEEESYVQQ